MTESNNTETKNQPVHRSQLPDDIESAASEIMQSNRSGNSQRSDRTGRLGSLLTFFKRPFSDQFPGPFGYRSGRDGVDDTFDVFCLTSDQWIISTYYWEERQRAELIARVVTDALNVAALDLDRRAVPTTQRRDMATFQQEYPGPYSIRRETCEYYGPCIEIVCDASNECVLFAPVGSSVRTICRHIAHSLNRFSEIVTSDPTKPVTE